MITVEKKDEKITVKFAYNKDYIETIKTIEGYGWDIQKKYWYFSNNDGIVEKILSAFPGEDICLDPALQEFYALERELVSRKYSQKTVKAYLRYNRELVNFAGKSSPEIDESDIKNYLFYLIGGCPTII